MDALRRAAAHQLVADVESVELDAAAEHHLFRVLRLRDGETVTVTDGEGRWRACRVAGGSLAPDTDVVAVPRPDPVTVGVAIPKSERPEWIVQKLTELGVDRIVFLHTARSVVRWDAARAKRNVERLRRVAAEALQQSRNVWLPAVEGPIPASELLASWPVAEPGGRPLATTDRGILIGPEGGWADDELAAAAGQVTLGDAVLRVETAALVAGALLVRHRGEAP